MGWIQLHFFVKLIILCFYRTVLSSQCLGTYLKRIFPLFQTIIVEKGRNRSPEILSLQLPEISPT